MRYIAGFVVFSIIFATIYGVIFSTVYPLVEIDGSMISLFVLLGLATSLICAGLFRPPRDHGILPSPSDGKFAQHLLPSSISSSTLSIFISYRRKDTMDLAGRIGDTLERNIVGCNVFREVVSIKPGTNWKSEIDNKVAAADIILALIGPNWMGRTQAGRPQIDQPDDWVRYEIEFALKSKKSLIPIVIQGCDFPLKNLPRTLLALNDLQPFVLDRDYGFEVCMRNLIKTVRTHQSQAR